MEATKATAADAGCWIDGHWGQYAVARMVEIATQHGYAEDAELSDIAARHLASMSPSTAQPVTDGELDALADQADTVENWLTEHVAPEGYSFGWNDGEFYMQSAEWWDEENC